jgi:hypothetical protein
MNKMAVHQIYRFYAELRDYTPKIWRRFEVNGTKTIAELGYTIMTMFEMQASHLFCFMYDQGAEVLEDMRKSYTDKELNSVLGKDYIADLLKPWHFELPSDEIFENENEKWHDAGKYRLKDITGNVPWKLAFEYDYGDGWQIDLTLESYEKAEISAVDLPRVLAGQGFGIIEDVGGVGGLKELAKAFKKKNGQQYEEYREWLDVDSIDLTAFDIDDMNFRLKKLPRIFKESYEYGYEPTQRSIDLIERKYKK